MPAPSLRTLVTAVLLAALLVGTWSNAADRAPAEGHAAAPAAPACARR